MGKRGPIDNRKVVIVALLIMIAAAAMCLTALKGERGKALAVESQPEAQKDVIWYTSLAVDE